MCPSPVVLKRRAVLDEAMYMAFFECSAGLLKDWFNNIILTLNMMSCKKISLSLRYFP